MLALRKVTGRGIENIVRLLQTSSQINWRIWIPVALMVTKGHSLANNFEFI